MESAKIAVAPNNVDEENTIQVFINTQKAQKSNENVREAQTTQKQI